MNEHVQAIELDLKESASHNYELDRVTLEMYCFLWYAILLIGESKNPMSTQVKKGKKNASHPWKPIKLNALSCMQKVLNLELNRFILMASEFDCLLNLITKALSLLLETPDTVKDESIRHGIIDIFCLIVSKHEKGPRSHVQGRILNEFLREEHLSDFLSEFMETLVNEFNGLLFFENVFKECSLLTFGEDSKSAKSMSKFLLKTTESLPLFVQKQMIHLQSLIDSEV